MSNLNTTRLFAPAEVVIENRPDGTRLLRSPHPLQPSDRCVGDWLVHWAQRAPRRSFLVERDGSGNWTPLTYEEALCKVIAISSWLLDQDLSPDRPVVILSDNSIENALISLAAQHIGVPAVPVSPAYSLVSRDHERLKAIISITRPGVIYAAEARRYAAALEAIAGMHSASLLVGRGQSGPHGATEMAALRAPLDASRVRLAFDAVGPDTIAKILFTSGTTGVPKGVVNTQRMLCVNQRQLLQVWPFCAHETPLVVDWLPWHHTFGGNHNFNFVLHTGGTLYIDDGRPAPTLFDKTLANLREVSPTFYFNVPRGFDLLIAALRAERALRESFFRRMQVIFYAAAALPQHSWKGLETLSLQTTGRVVPIVSSWGSTETAPLVTTCHYQADRAGVIGLPVPGCELKLVPQAGKLEVRVRGPQVTPGYWKQADLWAKSLDEEGFYRIGDAVQFVDESNPEKGLRFDGRIAEDFKLGTGTWVNAGEIRLKALAALGSAVLDVVVTGQDRQSIGLLLFPNLPSCRALCSDLPPDAPVDQVLTHPQLLAWVREVLEALRRRGTGSSTYASRAVFLAEPPSLDGGEITDKGSINQRAVLGRRQPAVDSLYADQVPRQVVALSD